MTQEFKSKVLKESLTYTESSNQAAFEDGVCFALNNIWHDSNKEQPEEGRTVLAYNAFYSTEAEVLHHCVNVYEDRIWCYLGDILPKKK